VKVKLGGLTAFLYLVIFLAIFGAWGYHVGVTWYDNPKTYERFEEMRKLVQNHKRRVTGKKPKHALSSEVQSIQNSLKESLLSRVND
jgi:hypothetical protein